MSTSSPGVRPDGLPGPGQNLVERALEACGRSAGVRLIKRIPLGGGLGGGSTDAGAVLRWARCADPEVAVGLGADVPFCVVGGRALVEGVGERVTPLPFQPRQFVLLLPPFGVETAWSTGPGTRTRRTTGPNALTAAALVVEPRLAAWRDALGAWAGTAPVLAGSGSTWFVEVGAAVGLGRLGRTDPANSASDQRPGGSCVPARCRRAGKGTEGEGRTGAEVTCRPGAATGWPSASSCASSCASACDAF